MFGFKEKEQCSHLVISDEMRQVVLQRRAVTATLHGALGLPWPCPQHVISCAMSCSGSRGLGMEQ